MFNLGLYLNPRLNHLTKAKFLLNLGSRKFCDSVYNDSKNIKSKWVKIDKEHIEIIFSCNEKIKLIEEKTYYQRDLYSVI